MSNNTPDFAALIGSRICHDLISPIGAINNGLELLGMAGETENWGFDMLFRILACAALLILCTVIALPRKLPTPETKPVAAE